MKFKLDTHGRYMMFAVILMIFLATLDQTIVTTALPTIASDLDNIKDLPWIITAYLLASTVSLPI